MSSLRFDGSDHAIQLIGSGGDITGPFTAYNNVDSHSKGPWPGGTYSFSGYNTHAELSDPDSEYGAHGILIFNVPGRTGMGVHSGRAEIADGLGRMGPKHCTLGCIRTTDEAMQAFLQIIAGDAMQSVEVDTGVELPATVRAGVAPKPRGAKLPGKKKTGGVKKKTSKARAKK